MLILFKHVPGKYMYISVITLYPYIAFPEIHILLSNLIIVLLLPFCFLSLLFSIIISAFPFHLFSYSKLNIKQNIAIFYLQLSIVFSFIRDNNMLLFVILRISETFLHIHTHTHNIIYISKYLNIIFCTRLMIILLSVVVNMQRML